jgi:phospholipid/cholesterol/gamma-HCH transport system substrate-binding protein
MKWSREIKVGILALVVILVLIWGYEFLKGKNVLGHSNTYKVAYTHIDQLAVSSPVFVKGFKVGMVTDIYLNPENIDEVIVEMEVDGEIKLPRDAKAILYSVGIVGGKAVILQYDHICQEDCLESGGFLEGEVRGLLSSMLPQNEMDMYLGKLQSGIGGVIDSLGFDGGAAGSDNTGAQLKEIVASFASITSNLDQLIARSDANINKSIADIQSFTSSLKENEQHLNQIMANLNVISTQVANAGLDQTIQKVDTTFDDLAVSIRDLKSIVESVDQSFQNIDKIVAQVEKGEGTLGKLVGQDSLYNDLSLTVQHLNLLLQDLRLNPKRYVNISVIGRKDKDYEKPEEDPAFGE